MLLGLLFQLLLGYSDAEFQNLIGNNPDLLDHLLGEFNLRALPTNCDGSCRGQDVARIGARMIDAEIELTAEMNQRLCDLILELDDQEEECFFSLDPILIADLLNGVGSINNACCYFEIETLGSQFEINLTALELHSLVNFCDDDEVLEGELLLIDHCNSNQTSECDLQLGFKRFFPCSEVKFSPPYGIDEISYYQFELDMKVFLFGCIQKFFNLDHWDASFEVSLPYCMVNNGKDIFNWDREATNVAKYMTLALEDALSKVDLGSGLDCNFEEFEDEFISNVGSYLRDLKNRNDMWDNGSEIAWRINGNSFTLPNCPIEIVELSTEESDLDCIVDP